MRMRQSCRYKHRAAGRWAPTPVKSPTAAFLIWLLIPIQSSAAVLAVENDRTHHGPPQPRQSSNTRRFSKGPFKRFRPSRRGPVHALSVAGSAEISLFLSGRGAVMCGRRHRNKFPFRAKGLRRAIMIVLERRSGLTAAQIASCTHSHGRTQARPGWRIPSESQIVAVRRALRHLVLTGQVRKCGRVRVAAAQRRRDAFELVRGAT